MLRLSAFADEISPDLDEQIRVCQDNAVTHFELRSVNKINVLDFDPKLRDEIKSKLDKAGIGVICIGSPIGKVEINKPWSEAFARFKTAVDMAEFFGAPLIRVFSYYAPEKDGDMRPYRDEVIKRFREKVSYIADKNVTLVHENEHAIYGEKGRECLDLMQTINSPKLRSAFDFANFIMDGEDPMQNWPSLKPFSTHIHIKDAKMKERKIVPAGEGDGHIGKILSDAYASGYRGFVSLEPHLATAGQMGGFSGADLFKRAADALKKVCRENNVPLAGG
jgi:sugar phosphate isomerase/epimerase